MADVLRNSGELLIRILRYLLTLAWLRELIALVRRWLLERARGDRLKKDRRGRDLSCRPDCVTVGPDVYRRADPLIYSQTYLREQGLAVTWNNPDIQLFKAGAPVSSSSLEADTDYEVVATIYNNSLDAPAVGMPVDFSFRSFGVGATETAIGTTIVNLPVKGAPGHPAKASMTWHTPTTPGHYCLKVLLNWTDDANPRNNLGQENTNVAAATSPAIFTFPVRNADVIRKLVRLVADAYTLPGRIDCDEKERERRRPRRDRKERVAALNHFQIPYAAPSEQGADWIAAILRHHPEAHPVPPGWDVRIEPDALDLGPGEEQNVTVSIEPPPSFQGQKSFNINAMHGTDLAGGVTLTVTKE